MSERKLGHSPKWRQFEETVAGFLARIDPKAKVMHNASTPDRDTGTDRQRDVWVEASICGFPVSMLVSCKRYGRKLNQQDVDAFIGELCSSGAQKGVLFSYKGFTQPAIEKCKTRGISCCSPIHGVGFDLPKSIGFSFYCCESSLRVALNSDCLPFWGKSTFAEAFLAKGDGEDKSKLDILIEHFNIAQEEAAHEVPITRKFPKPWSSGIEITNTTVESPVLRIVLKGVWRIYRARLDGQLINGFYSFSEETYTISRTGPLIDLGSSEPGPSWEKIDSPPEAFEESLGIVFLLNSHSIKDQLMTTYGPKRLQDI